MKKILAIVLSLLTLAAAFALPMNAADSTIVTAGLVIHYDGANNTGAGQDIALVVGGAGVLAAAAAQQQRCQQADTDDFLHSS